MDIVKLLVILALIILALRRNVPVGVTLFAAGLVTALLYLIPPGAVFEGYWELIKSTRFLSLTGVIILITILGSLLKEMGFLERLASACQRLYGGARTAVVLLPFLIGLMPMPGGALLSAPLVDKLLSGNAYEQSFKTAVNYWFRHMVEFFWPVYPGIILTAAITGLPLISVCLLQMPLTLVMLGIGLFFFARRVPVTGIGTNSSLRAVVDVLLSLWPILTSILIFAVTGIELVLAILLGIGALILIRRPARKTVGEAVRKGANYKLVFLVFGILSFQSVLQLSGAIDSIPALAATYNLPQWALIFFVCFSLGLLTGMVAAYVGMGYAILAGFLYQPILQPGNIIIAYLSGYMGMMLSPTHLCLVLTNEYFRSDLVSVYRVLIVPIILLAVAGFLLAFSGWGTLFIH